LKRNLPTGLTECLEQFVRVTSTLGSLRDCGGMGGQIFRTAQISFLLFAGAASCNVNGDKDTHMSLFLHICCKICAPNVS
jgi:hypothetical protein